MIRETESRWLMLTQVYLGVLSVALAFQCIPPAMSLIIDEFHFTHHQAGLLMSLFSLPAVFLSMPVGVLTDRFGNKPVVLAGLFLTVVGSVITSLGDSFALLSSGRIIAGVGSISIIVVAPQTIAQWFKNKEIGVAMGIFNTATPVGIILSLNFLSMLAARWGWRSGVWTTVFVSTLTLVVVALFFKSRDRTIEEGSARPHRKEGNERSRMAIWLVALIWGLFTSSTISLLSFAPDFLIRKGLTLQAAGLSASAVMGGSLFLSPVIGYIADRYRHQEALIAIGGIGMAVFVAVLIGAESHYMVIMVLVGVFGSFMPAPLFSLPAQLVSGQRLGWAFGTLAMINNLGVFVGPQLVGFSRDVTGSYRVGFGLITALITLAAVLAILLKYHRAKTYKSH
jgi:predicted MFS family arabinose efflux permease